MTLIASNAKAACSVRRDGRSATNQQGNAWSTDRTARNRANSSDQSGSHTRIAPAKPPRSTKRTVSSRVRTRGKTTP